jgi:AraC-like DNA-binding protein
MSDESSSKRVAIAAYSRSIADALEQRGVDSSQVFEKAGVPMHNTTDPLRRITNQEISALFRESVASTDDPYFGLFVAEVFHISQLHALGFALLVSSTLRDFCQRLTNFYRLASQNVDIRLEESAQEAVLAVKLLQPGICFETRDTFAGVMVRLIRDIGKRDFSPLRVELPRPLPPAGDQPYRDFFGCDVLFDQPEIRIKFDSESIDLPLAGGSQELAQMHDRTAMEYLKKLDRQNISNLARSLIVDKLSTGLVSKQWVADGLNISSRSLDLKLVGENTNFQQILDSTRQSLAAGYMEQSSLSITEIAYLLGFSDAANFTRAFRRWNGESPSDFRRSIGLSR